MVTRNRLFWSPQLISLLIIGVWVFLVFLPALKGEFLNWDDHSHLVNNSAIKNFDIVQIFSESVQKIYIPLTSLTFAIEYKFFGDQPFVYHFNNLLLHVFNSVLVYFFASQLGIGRTGAFFSALLFGVHPMRVESVAWVTERKDLLYAFFYLIAMQVYLRYLTTTNKKIMWASYGFGFLSLLAKPMALSLPLVLFILDWFKKQKVTAGDFLEKFPLGLTFLPVIWMTYQWHVRNPIKDILESVLTWIWTFNFYLWKFCWPADLSAIYQFPEPASFSNSVHVLSVISFLFALLLIYLLRRNRWVVFAFLFYLGSIFFLLRFDHANDINIVADRFMYLPGLGFCLLAGVGVENMLKRFASRHSARSIVFFAACSLAAVLSVQSLKQVSVWNNSITLWTQVIEKYPEEFIAYNDRAAAFIARGRNDLALNDYSAIIKFGPGHADAHYNRGLLLQKMGQQDRAVMDFGEVIKEYPYYERVYDSRAKSFEAMGRDDLAVEDYTRAVMVTPAYVDAYLHRGNVFNRQGLLDQALTDYLKVLEINPQHARALNNCATIYAKLGDDQKAFEYVDRAIALDPFYADAFYNRSVLYHQRGEHEKSTADLKRSRELAERSSSEIDKQGPMD